MSRKARTRAAVASVIALVVGGALAFGQLTGTLAVFNAETDNAASAFNGGWIPKPTSPSSSANGSPYSTEHLAWTSGNSTVMPGAAANPVTGQSLYYADGGSGGSASCGSYSSFSSLAAAATTADVTGTNLTDWWCYEVFSTSSSASTSGTWTSDVATFGAVRLFVPTAVAFSNAGGTAGSIEKGDKIAITFNQAPSNPGTITVSTTTTTITIGSLGTITGLTIGGSRTYDTSTSSVAGSVLTITINASGNGSSTHAATVSGTGTFTGGSLTAATGTHLCTAAACTVSTSGSF